MRGLARVGRGEKGAHWCVAFHLRDEDDVAILFDGDICRLAARAHQLLQKRPADRAELAKAHVGRPDLEGFYADRPRTGLTVMGDHAMLGEGIEKSVHSGGCHPGLLGEFAQNSPITLSHEFQKSKAAVEHRTDDEAASFKGFRPGLPLVFSLSPTITQSSCSRRCRTFNKSFSIFWNR